MNKYDIHLKPRMKIGDEISFPVCTGCYDRRRITAIQVKEVKMKVRYGVEGDNGKMKWVSSTETCWTDKDMAVEK